MTLEMNVIDGLPFFYRFENQFYRYLLEILGQNRAGGGGEGRAGPL
jgi:hypothetical protein